MGVKGYKHTPEAIRKIKEARKLQVITDETKKKISETVKKNPVRYWLGKKFSADFKKKLSQAGMGKITPWRIGEKSNFWKGGISSINLRIRGSAEYRIWRTAVFERDNHTCIWCGQRGGRLNADHIKPFAYYPELRFAIDNGRTLCVPCHKTTDTYAKNKPT